MISILLVDDNQPKVAAVASAIGNGCRLTIAMNVVDAKKQLQSNRFDLLLLDINLPQRANSPPRADGGLEVLRWLKAKGQPYRPAYIVGLTEFDSSFEKAKSEFNNLIWRVISVEIAKSKWRDELRQTVVDLQAQVKPPFVGDGATFRTDILLVTALEEPELSAVLQLAAGFERIEVQHDASAYHYGKLVDGRRSVSVVAVAASDKGLAGAAIAATKGIQAFWPRMVYMTGITAGVKGRTKIGDIIFADPSWDWGSGKLKKVKGREQFMPAPYQRRIDETLSRQAKALKGDAALLDRIWNTYEKKKPSSAPKILIGALASGASVLSSMDAVKRVVAQHKDLLGIEMEAFSVMFACQASAQPRPLVVVAKSVCDFGDGKKNDLYQRYAAYTSAKVFEAFALRYVAAKSA
jgi:nucleoside phosphorylase